MRRLSGVLMLLGCLIFLSPGCSSYQLTLNGKSIPAELKTINISFFENNATLVVPTLSRSFTESLKDRVRTTTSISIRESGPVDARMSGEITGYTIAPISIQATNGNTPPIAGASVLAITVHVKFEYDLDKTSKGQKISFDQSFTKTMNYTGDIANQEQALIQAIDKQLIDDIFNKAFNNW